MGGSLSHRVMFIYVLTRASTPPNLVTIHPMMRTIIKSAKRKRISKLIISLQTLCCARATLGVAMWATTR